MPELDHEVIIESIEPGQLRLGGCIYWLQQRYSHIHFSPSSIPAKRKRFH